MLGNKLLKPAHQQGRVITAMSGGVDSSTVAALLKKRGYDVIGIFMLMHKNSNPIDAKKMARKIGIPFQILDVRKEFKKRVIDYLIREYKKGNTPNPCVECNRWIKFRFLINELNRLKADYVATGHYAKVENSRLLVAKDIKKDQSYFLWTLKQKQLAKILFPLGDYTKEQVRRLAKKFGLSVHEKKDSQDICFDLPRRSLRTEAGDIITIDGKKIGEHKRLNFYTIGQRKGIEIGPPRLAEASRREAGGTKPYYVVGKDLKNNALIVSDSEKDLLRKEMIAKSVNWLDKPKKFPFSCSVKIRSMAKAAPARIMNQESTCLPARQGIKNCVQIIFDKSQRAITPGQSAVFYKGSELLGGGVIY